MGEEIGGKGLGVVHVAKLREMLQKVQSLALGPRAEGEEGETHRQSAGTPPEAAEGRRLRSLRVVCDLEEESCQSPEPPPDVPRGCFAVYVGQEQRRFVIPTSYLALPVFRVLLEKAEEEFGFDHKGAITLPCEIETFKYILQCMERQQTTERDGMLR